MVVAGEASGDAHAAALVHELRRLRPEVTFFGMGGAALKSAGVELTHSSREISVMGVVEVLPKLARILTVMGELAAEAAKRRPVLAVLVDAPDFNLRLAAKLKRLGVAVVGYVSPMVWAWRAGRTKLIGRVLDELLCILPFEEAFLRERGVNARYVGNPVLDQVPAPRPATDFRSSLGLALNRRTLAVLPGSRSSEISRLLPVMTEVTRRLTAQGPLQVVVPIAPGVRRETIASGFAAQGLSPVLIDGRAAECVGAADVALVASGTATLEAALMERPLVCIYRVAPTTYWIGKALVTLPFFCLVNLLLGEGAVPELLQSDAEPDTIVRAIDPLWAGEARIEQLRRLSRLREVLGGPGASARAAARVAGLLDARAPK